MMRSSHAGSWRNGPGCVGTVRRGSWPARALKGLDDDHVPAAAWAWRACVVRLVRHLGRGGRCDAEQLTDVVETGLAGGAGEQAVVADAVEALGQDVEQEAADELVGGDRYRRRLFTLMSQPPAPEWSRNCPTKRERRNVVGAGFLRRLLMTSSRLCHMSAGASQRFSRSSGASSSVELTPATNPPPFRRRVSIRLKPLVKIRKLEHQDAIGRTKANRTLARIVGVIPDAFSVENAALLELPE